MKANTIPIIPENGYNPLHKTSIKCQLWLKYVSETENIYIRHAKNGGEIKCGPYLLDGVCEQTKTIYEFHGCYFHGCLICYTDSTFNTLKQLHQHSVHLRHLDRIKYIKQNMPDYKLIEIWEHEWDFQCRTSTNLQEFLEKNQVNEPINPRDALFGGRTNALKLYHKCGQDEKIHYYDYTSLYPYVQKYGQYPIGHPKQITENFDYQPGKYFGLIKCKILPPKELYIPVLPARINDKLIFCLCNTCAANNQKLKCHHNDQQRALEGTWVSLEIEKAIEKGYKILEIYEVWHWEQKEQYDNVTKQGGIFTDYINKALQEKQEASGYPEGCITDQQREEYIKSYYDNEGIVLDTAKIASNKGKRAVAKLKANSLWGFFAMKTNRVQYKIITTMSEWQQMLTNQQYIIHNVYFNKSNHLYKKHKKIRFKNKINNTIQNDDNGSLQVFYSVNNEAHYGSTKTNVVIASFVTCQARLHLYSELEKLQQRVLYFDTDSIIFTSKPGEYMPKLGVYLGQLTCEIDKKEGQYIVEFVSAGPKNYAYMLDTGITHCTVKGFTLNHLTSLKITFEKIKQIVCSDQQEKIECAQIKFTRDKSNWSLQTDLNTKQYGFVYDKRVILEDLSTLPFGY